MAYFQLVSSVELASALPSATNEERAEVINFLLQQNRIQLLGTAESPHFRAVAPEEAAKYRGLGQEEILLYQTIGNAGNLGIWTRDMKVKTNLPQGKIVKHLKTLEERGLIKSVKSVQNANRKVYMLAELEPAKSLTGGPWYGNDQHIDTEFIAIIREIALQYLAKSEPQPLSVEEVSNFIVNSKVTNQALQQEDVAHVLTTLRYDGEIEDVDIGDGVLRYRLQYGAELESTPLSEVPCGSCPVFQECCEDGHVSPQTCEYFTKWLHSLSF